MLLHWPTRATFSSSCQRILAISRLERLLENFEQRQHLTKEDNTLCRIILPSLESLPIVGVPCLASHGGVAPHSRPAPVHKLLRLLFANQGVGLKRPINHIPRGKALRCLERGRRHAPDRLRSSIVSARRTSCARWMAVELYKPVS